MDDRLSALAAVAVGSALGGGARFLVSGLVARRIGETFPWGTLAVNVSGAFALGLLAGLGLPDVVWSVGAVGFLGSYTTVSSLSLQTLALLRTGDTRRAGANVLLSLGLGLGAAALGLAVGGA